MKILKITDYDLEIINALIMDMKKRVKTTDVLYHDRLAKLFYKINN